MNDPLPNNITNNINNIVYFLVKKIDEISKNLKEQEKADLDIYGLPELQEHYANLGKTLFSGVCHRMGDDIFTIQEEIN